MKEGSREDQEQGGEAVEVRGKDPGEKMKGAG